MDFRYCRKGDDARELAAFFAANITPEYISHAELMGPRALDPSTWSPELLPVLTEDFAVRLNAPLDAAPGEQTLLAAKLIIEGRLCGVFMITFSRVSKVPHCVLEDIVIDASLRGQKLGTQYFSWIDAECKARGIPRMFLESGYHNHGAHHLFEKMGFEKVSFVMMRTLDQD